MAKITAKDVSQNVSGVLTDLSTGKAQLRAMISSLRNRNDEILRAERADRELERLWDDGTINEETLKLWEHEHMRTPYKQNNTDKV